jgi:diguanylate cyclase (GGDEF)-like protein
MKLLDALIAVRDPLLRAQLKSGLARAGLRVSEAGSADAALAVARGRMPILVVLEQALDGGAGAELARALRALPGGDAVVIFALTEPRASARELASEANDLIPKPVDLERFEKRVRLFLRGAAAATLLEDARDALQSQLRTFDLVHARAGLGVWECDPATNELALTPAALRVLGLERAPASLEALLLEAVHAADRQKVAEALSACAIGADVPSFEHRAAGSLRFIRHFPLRSRAEGASELALSLLAQDVTSERVAEDRLQRIALYDPVTELPGREIFEARLQRALRSFAEAASYVALLWVELGGLRTLRESHGEGAHDEALRAVATRLVDALRTHDSVGHIASRERGVARFEGERFAVILTQVQRAEDAATCAKRVAAALAQPIEIRGVPRPILLQPHLGVALAPRDGAAPAELIASAQRAALGAARTGIPYRFPSGSQAVKEGRIATIVADLQGAAERGELSLLLQPRIGLASRRVVGAEALVRWLHPHLGEVAPKEFIGVAERDGVIDSIGQWVLSRAVAEAARWPAGRISVNVSRSQLLSGDFARTVFRALIDAQLRPEQIELEVTESLMYESENCLEPLRELAAVGVTLALDDFGSGYSSLSALVRFPVHVIKIDRSIVKDIDENPDAMRVVRGVVRVAHDLGMRVVAEGVDREGQVPLLAEAECDEAQGFLFAKPLRPEEFAQFVADWDPEATDFGRGGAGEAGSTS